MRAYADLADLPEDDRIQAIGEHIMAIRPKIKVGIIVDSDPGKLERYTEKLLKAFPKILVHSVSPGPIPQTRTLTVWRLL